MYRERGRNRDCGTQLHVFRRLLLRTTEQPQTAFFCIELLSLIEITPRYDMRCRSWKSLSRSQEKFCRSYRFFVSAGESLNWKREEKKIPTSAQNWNWPINSLSIEYRISGGGGRSSDWHEIKIRLSAVVPPCVMGLFCVLSLYAVYASTAMEWQCEIRKRPHGNLFS